MGNFVNRTTLARIRSGNDPDYADPPWLNVPNGSGNETLLDTVPAKYLILTGDVLSEIDGAAKAVVDAALLEASRDSAIAEVDALEGITRALAKLVLSEINLLRAEHGLAARTLAQLRTAMRNGMGS